MPDVVTVLCSCTGVALAAGAVLLAVRGRRIVAFLRALRMAAGPLPPRITLAPDTDPRPPVPARFHAEVATLLDLGYRSIGRYRVAALGDARVHGFTADDHVAAVYAHPVGGVWVDFAEQSDDGAERTVTSAPPQPELARPPWRTLTARPGVGTRELLDTFRAGRLAAPTLPPGSFAEHFERAWAREMDWRNARGGPSLEEVRAHGPNATDDAVRATRRQLHRHALAGLEVAFRERCAELGLPDGAYVYVHDALEPDDLRELLADTYGLPPAEGPPREAFRAAIEAGLPEAARPRFVVHLATPVPTDVWEPAAAP